jgi:putative YhdH/YhfP family quinone oxidoreductase
MAASPLTCFVVRKDDQGQIVSGLESHALGDLPAGDVLIRVRYSSLNYKDALAATGNPAVAKSLPHVPGIDAAGTVVSSSDPRFLPGEPVIATGHEFGVERWGGWSEYLQAPANWLVHLPDGLTLEESMIYGTAGFTAAQCVQALRHQGVSPASGDVIVSGASGGVGCLAVMLLARLGYRVVAVSGKPDQYDWLKSIGAAEVAGRELLGTPSTRPLLSAKFAGGVDTVGGMVLSTMCKMISHRGAIACCGVAGGADLALTVYPFILRGLTLCGIDSAWCPDDERADIWQKLAGAWKPDALSSAKELVALTDVPDRVTRILKGENARRAVVDLGER